MRDRTHSIFAQEYFNIDGNYRSRFFRFFSTRKTATYPYPNTDRNSRSFVLPHALHNSLRPTITASSYLGLKTRILHKPPPIQLEPPKTNGLHPFSDRKLETVRTVRHVALMPASRHTGERDRYSALPDRYPEDGRVGSVKVDEGLGM